MSQGLPLTRDEAFGTALVFGPVVQAVLGAGAAYGLGRALPAQGIHGSPLSLTRILSVLVIARSFWGLFRLCWIILGCLGLVVVINRKAKLDLKTLLGFAVAAFFVPCIFLPRLSDTGQLAACALATIPFAIFLASISSEPLGEFVRGTRQMKGGQTSETFAQLLSQAVTSGDKPGIIFWGTNRLPFSKENQHLLVVGSPGSGKTQIIYPLVRQVLERGDKAIIWDVKGTYTQALLGRSGVQLLAPWDARSLAWRPGADIIRPLDCEQAAHVLIAENPRDPQPFFSNAARQLLEAVLIQLDAGGDSWGWLDVWEMLAQGKDALAKTLQRSSDGRAAASVITGESKGSQDVYATLLSSVQSIKWLAKAWPKEGISLRQWVRAPAAGGQALILGGIPEREKLAGMVANLAIQTMVNAVNSLPDDLNRRIWFFLDELASLGRIDAIARLSTMGRSKGGCVVAGIQDIGQIEHLYGRDLAKSLANTFRTTILLRCADAATSEWAAGVIGKQEIIEQRRSWSEGSHSNPSASGSSQSESVQEVVREKHVFMPSQIANFEDMVGVFRLAGWPVAHLRWPKQVIPQTGPLVQEAAWLSQKALLDPPPPGSDREGAKWKV